MTRKYEFTGETKQWFGRTLHRVRAVATIASIGVSVGDVGGWIETEGNLSRDGNAWVYGNAHVSGDARVYGNAWVSGNARVSGDAQVYGNARVYGDARVSGNAEVYVDAQVYGNAWVSGDAQVYGNAQVYGDAQVYGNAHVSGDARVYGNAWVSGDAWVSGNAQVSGNAEVVWLSHVGSGDGTLTLFRTKDGECVNRGCFTGTLNEFEEAVLRRHPDNLHGKEYALIIQMFRLRVASWPARQKGGDA
jgi:carbonic anhydrase/acetyltransferase-like protein (isoleucine patch superfamily)